VFPFLRPLFPDSPPPVPPAVGTGTLSDREREVARLVVAGQTYREIGGRLYISAKTVEHHVSRMRQRLGAGTRSDLLARLRAELAEQEDPPAPHHSQARGGTLQGGHPVSL
jgi:DNA-binding CsgD family transcriptional regulator